MGKKKTLEKINKRLDKEAAGNLGIKYKEYKSKSADELRKMFDERNKKLLNERNEIDLERETERTETPGEWTDEDINTLDELTHSYLNSLGEDLANNIGLLSTKS